MTGLRKNCHTLAERVTGGAVSENVKFSKLLAKALTPATVGGLILLSAGIVGAQITPCIHLPTDHSSFEYKERGNRCEGLYVANVGAKSLELVSLTQGPLAYELKPGVVLRVSVPFATGRVHVRAVSKIPRTYYQMDALLQEGFSLDWPVNDVLLPEKLDSDRIGVFAWVGEDDNKTILPVHVTVVGAQPFKPKKTYLSVRPTFDVEKIEWRFAPMNAGHCLVFGSWKHALRDQALGGQPVDIALDGLAGHVCLEVAAEAESSNDWTTLPLRLELAAQ